ncbi:MAG: metal-dependent hydrolase [Planctomycetes bacterium]|nr:metal-dependent hydrolase [Planctomycetota bacterium]
MPYPVYHLGVSGFFGLALRRFLDLPVLLLVNIPIDLEVLFASGRPASHHRHWHFHTLLVGGLIGTAVGLLVYHIRPVRKLITWTMNKLRIPYQPVRWKMVLSGILGVWLHVVLDAIYHYDVQLFWPLKARNLQRPLWRLVTAQQEEYICIALSIAAAILYILTARAYNKNKL